MPQTNPPEFNLTKFTGEKHGCPGPCEACHPTYYKRVQITQRQEVYRTTFVIAMSASQAAKAVDDAEFEYDWEHEPGDWETVEACSVGPVDPKEGGDANDGNTADQMR